MSVPTLDDLRHTDRFIIIEGNTSVIAIAKDEIIRINWHKSQGNIPGQGLKTFSDVMVLYYRNRDGDVTELFYIQSVPKDQFMRVLAELDTSTARNATRPLK